MRKPSVLDRRRTTLLVASLALVVTAIAAVQLSVLAREGQDPGKAVAVPPRPTYASQPEEVAAQQTAALGTTVRARDYWKEYAATGKPLEALPHGEGRGYPLEVVSWGDSLAEAVAGTSGALRGVVERQEIGPGYVDSYVRVSAWLVAPGGDIVRVRQTGGPAWNNGDPALAQSDQDQILHLGAEYILFLDTCVPGYAEQAVNEGFLCIRLRGRQIAVGPGGELTARYEYEPWTKELPLAPAFEAQIRAAAVAAGR